MALTAQWYIHWLMENIAQRLPRPGDLGYSPICTSVIIKLL